MQRATLIVNPYSTAVTRARVEAVCGVLRERVELVVEPTTGPGHATELAAAAAADADAVIVFSGDGTYNEALNGADGRVPFGFLPGGGTSVFARALGLPREPVAAARVIAEALAEGRSRRITLGRVNGRRFCFSAGLGFDAEAVRRHNRLGRDAGGARPGDISFARMTAAMLLERRGHFPPILEIAGYGSAAFALVANCDPYTYAGARPLHVAPDARFELGLDFVAPVEVKARSLPGLVTYLLRGRGRIGSGDMLVGHDLDHIEITCTQPVPLQADGEDLGDVTAAVFDAERDAVAVLI